MRLDEPFARRAAVIRCDLPTDPTANETCWRCGPIDGVTQGPVTHLLATEHGSELDLRNGRLTRGARYSASPRATRRYLARVGAMLQLRTRGRYHLHAAGVVSPDGRSWLLCGESGTGKSTLAYVLARQGWPVLGDDGVVLEATEDGVLGYAWREPMQVSIELAQWFPELHGRAALTNWADPRHRAPVETMFVRQARIAGLLVLERGAADVLTCLAPAAALAVLVRQSTFLLLTDGHARAHLAVLQELVQSVPCYTLRHTNEQLDEFPSTMRTLVA